MRERRMQYYALGHRGWAGAAPENTLSSFKMALEEPRTSIMECDVQLSKDGELVVVHDFTLERTSNGRGPVAERSLAELKELDFGSKFSPEFAGERIPTLRELLDLVGGKKDLVIEMKRTADLYPDIAERLLEAVDGYPADKLYIESFDHRLMKRFKAAAPEYRTGIICYEDSTLVVDEVEATESAFAAIYFGNLSQELADRLSERGIEIIAWTLNQAWQYEYLKGLDGVFYVASDYPGLAVEMLGEGPLLIR